MFLRLIKIYFFDVTKTKNQKTVASLRQLEPTFLYQVTDHTTYKSKGERIIRPMLYLRKRKSVEKPTYISASSQK